MQHKSQKIKQKLTPIVSLHPREICFIQLDNYKVWCRNCGAVNDKKIKCTTCNYHFAVDSRQRGRRPVAVLYCPPMDGNSKEEAMVLAIPLTSQTQDSEPGTVVLPANTETKLDGPAQALVYQLTAIDKNGFFEENRRGRIGDKEWGEIKEKLKNLLGIDDKNILLPDGRTMHVAQIMSDLSRLEGGKKELAGIDELKKRVGQLKYQHEADQSAQQNSKKYFQQELAKRDKEIERLRAEVENLKNSKEQPLSMSGTE